MKTYRWNATDYEKHSSQQQLWARELIQKLALRGDETALDVGCGDGKVTAEIAASLPRGNVVGVDMSAEMIALAQQRYPRRDNPSLRFQVGNASELGFRDVFSIVFSNATLHWIIDHRPVLRGIYRSLKPGGKTLLQMGGQGNAAGIIAALDDVIAESAWRKYFEQFVFPYGFYGVSEYRQWLIEAGFSPMRVELLEKDMVHLGEAGLAGWLRTTWMPYTQCVPEEKRDKFILDLVGRYLDKNPLDANGFAHVAMVRLEVEAFKEGILTV